MTRARVSVTIEADLLSEIREVAGPRGVSRFLSESAQRELAWRENLRSTYLGTTVSERLAAGIALSDAARLPTTKADVLATPARYRRPQPSAERER